MRVSEKEQARIEKAAKSVYTPTASWARAQLLAAADAVVAARQTARLEQRECGSRIKQLESEVSADE